MVRRALLVRVSPEGSGRWGWCLCSCILLDALMSSCVTSGKSTSSLHQRAEGTSLCSLSCPLAPFVCPSRAGRKELLGVPEKPSAALPGWVGAGAARLPPHKDSCSTMPRVLRAVLRFHAPYNPQESVELIIMPALHAAASQLFAHIRHISP